MKKYFTPCADITNISTRDIIQDSNTAVYENYEGDVAAPTPGFWEGLL